MILFDNLILEDFRGIRKMPKPLKLAKMNLLIGRNNSGKSTILSALSLLPHPMTKIKLLNEFQYSFLQESVINAGVLASKPFVYRYEGIAKIKCEMYGFPLEIRIDSKKGPSHAIFGTQNYFSDFSEMKSLFSRLAKKDPRFNFKDPENISLFIPNLESLFKRIIELLGKEENWVGVEKSDAHTNVVTDFINKCIDEDFSEVTPKFKGTLYLRKVPPNAKAFHVRVVDMGDGIEKVVSILLWLETVNPRIILWDDFETSMHPSLIKAVLTYLNSKEWQVVLSTHSIDALMEIIDLQPKDAKIILIKKDSEANLHHKSFTLEEIETEINAKRDPRKLVDLLNL